jgi:NADH-quinone oxidoreductase subunit M
MLDQIFASDQIGFPVLTLLILLPLAAALFLMRMRDAVAATKFALAVSFAQLVIATLVWMNFQSGTSAMQFVEQSGTLPLLGFSYHLGLDGISMLFVPATALLSFLAILYTDASVRQNVGGYLAALLAFEAAMMGAFMSLDLMLFWVFFVAELIPSYYLIVRWGTGERRREAAQSYLSYMGLASAALLAAILLLGAQASSGAAEGSPYNYLTLLQTAVPAETQTMIFFLLCLGFAIKAPLFPFHTWMPKVLEQGPVVGMSVFLVGIKLGAFGFLRFVIPLAPEASQEWYWLLGALGAVSMIYGALIALVQVNLRRVLAFASLSHMGVVMLGLFALNFQGMQGGLLQMLNLGITGAGLFFVAGFLHTRMGAPDVTRMGGFQQKAPLLAMTFLVIGLAAIGMPGTSGFNGEHLVMLGAFKKHWLMAVGVGLGTMLTAAYFLWYYQRAFLGDRNDATAPGMTDLSLSEKAIAGSVLGIVFWIGLYTTPFLATMNGSITGIEQHIGASGAQAVSGTMPLTNEIVVAEAGIATATTTAEGSANQ